MSGPYREQSVYGKVAGGGCRFFISQAACPTNSAARPEASAIGPETAIPPDENDPRMSRSKERHTANNGQILFFIIFVRQQNSEKQNEQNYNRAQK